MKKIVISGVKTCAIKEVPTPKATEDWALVKIHAAPMCTEYKSYAAGRITEYWLGHEAAGEVVDVSRPGLVNVGDRVVVMPQYPCGRCALCLAGDYIHCQINYDIEAFTGSPEGSSSYAQYLLKPAWLLPKIPDDLSYDHASMICCGLGPTFGAMMRMNVTATDTVLITGMGPVGLGGIINGMFRNARVIAAEYSSYRANLAKTLGPETVINPKEPSALQQILDMTNGLGVDKAIDCSGNSSAQRLCIDATRRKGDVAFVGEAGELSIKVSDDLIRKGLKLHGVWHYNLNDIPKLFQIVQRQRDLVSRLITHTFPFNNVGEAWELQLTHQCGKVILHPWK